MSKDVRPPTLDEIRARFARMREESVVVWQTYDDYEALLGMVDRLQELVDKIAPLSERLELANQVVDAAREVDLWSRPQFQSSALPRLIVQSGCLNHLSKALRALDGEEPES